MVCNNPVEFGYFGCNGLVQQLCVLVVMLS